MSEEKKLPRWYALLDKRTGTRCLVEASNRAQAFRRAGEYYFTAEVATVADAIKMTRDGSDVISAPMHPEQLDLEEQAAEPAFTPDKPLGLGPLEPEQAVPPLPVANGGKGEATPAPAEIVGAGSLSSDPAPRRPFDDGRPYFPGEKERRTAPTARKASSVFGPGFGPKDEPDVG